MARAAKAAAKTAPVVEPVDDPRARLLARLEAERERNKRASEPPPRGAPGETYRATPTQGEADLARARGNPVPNKCWDLSPVDQASFDPTPGPALPAAPTNSALPFVTVLDTLEVGRQVVCSIGTWTGSPTTARQWLRNGASIWGATGVAYTLDYRDLGAQVGCTVRATNAGGSASANAVPVGPVEPAP